MSVRNTSKDGECNIHHYKYWIQNAAFNRKGVGIAHFVSVMYMRNTSKSISQMLNVALVQAIDTTCSKHNPIRKHEAKYTHEMDS